MNKICRHAVSYTNGPKVVKIDYYSKTVQCIVSHVELDGKADYKKAEKLLREARKARTQARVRSQEEGVYSRLDSSVGLASESDHSNVPAVSAPAPASDVDEREDSLVIEEKPSLSDAGEEAAVGDYAPDDNRLGAF